jgi:hypothetical protein
LYLNVLFSVFHDRQQCLILCDLVGVLTRIIQHSHYLLSKSNELLIGNAECCLDY